MLIVGLTGGIGSGKSTVANLFADRGAAIIDADVVAREVTAVNTKGYASIVKHFGVDILLPDQTLARGKLRQIIFENPKERLWLEKLLHPIIKQEMAKQIEQMKAPYCIAVIPLLLEVEFYSFINRILVVDIPESEQIRRVMLRDKILQTEVEAILKTQSSRQDRRAKAQDIIMNDGSMNDLISQVEMLDKKYREMS